MFQMFGAVSMLKIYAAGINNAEITEKWDRIIKLKFNSGNTTEYEYKSNVKIDLRYYSEDEEGLEKAVDNESSDERMITIEINSNNIVTSIESTEI